MKKRTKQNRHRLLRRLLALTCALLLGLCLLPLPARAEEPETDAVRVGYYENEVFQEGAAEGAVKTGYAYEYYRKISEYTGWKYDYVYADYGELYQMLLDGEIDLLAGLAWRKDRTGLLSYPEKPMGYESYIFIRHDADTDITADPRTLSGRKIGVLDSAMVDVLNAYLREQSIKAEVLIYASHEKLYQDFDSHAYDVMVAEGDGTHWRSHAEVLFPFGATDYYLCVNKKRPDLLAELNTAQTLLAAEEPNYLNSLREKYYSVSVTSRAFSAAEREWIDTHEVLHVGYLENYLPYSDTDSQGQVTGVAKDILPEIFRALDIQNIAITYDDTVYEITATLRNKGDGTIEVTTDKVPGACNFVNTYETKGEVTFSGAVPAFLMVTLWVTSLLATPKLILSSLHNLLPLGSLMANCATYGVTWMLAYFLFPLAIT